MSDFIIYKHRRLFFFPIDPFAECASARAFLWILPSGTRQVKQKWVAVFQLVSANNRAAGDGALTAVRVEPLTLAPRDGPTMRTSVL